MSYESAHHDSGTYSGKLGSVPVGETYKSYNGPEENVAMNDIIVFDAPEPAAPYGQCDLTSTYVVVSYIETVYAFSPSHRAAAVPEVGIAGPLGRIDISDPYVYVIQTGGDTETQGYPFSLGSNAPQWAVDMAMKLHENDDWDSYYSREEHAGWSAIGKEEIENFNTCHDCATNEYGSTYIDGE